MRKVGRPLKYTPQLLSKFAQALHNYVISEPLPLLKDFANTIDVEPQRITEFDKMSEEFSLALKKAKSYIEVKWVRHLATSKIPPASGIFILKNISEMRDEQYIHGEGFNNIFNVVIDKSYKPRHANNRLLNEATK